MNVSIAMATYNGARFIEEQLASFSRQTALPHELVVCDDGSTDDTLELVKRFARTAPFDVRLEPNERRLGASGNFLKAASLCRHDWIAFSDQDDVWDPAKLEVVAEIVRRQPAALLVAHRAALADESLRPLGELLHVPDVRRVRIVPRLGTSFWSYPYGFTMTFAARLVRDFPVCGRPVESHDRWIFILATALGEAVLLPQPLAWYRRHSSNLSVLHPPTRLSIDLVRSTGGNRYGDEGELVGRLAEYFGRRACMAGEGGPALLEASAAYGKMAAHFSLRSAFGQVGLGRAARARLFGRLVAAGAYRGQRRGGLGWRASLKDAARLVIG